MLRWVPFLCRQASDETLEYYGLKPQKKEVKQMRQILKQSGEPTSPPSVLHTPKRVCTFDGASGYSSELDFTPMNVECRMENRPHSLSGLMELAAKALIQLHAISGRDNECLACLFPQSANGQSDGPAAVQQPGSTQIQLMERRGCLHTVRALRFLA